MVFWPSLLWSTLGFDLCLTDALSPVLCLLDWLLWDWSLFLEPVRGLPPDLLTPSLMLYISVTRRDEVTACEEMRDSLEELLLFCGLSVWLLFDLARDVTAVETLEPLAEDPIAVEVF